VKRLTERCEKQTAKPHADKPTRDDYPQARATASRRKITANVALASVGTMGVGGWLKSRAEEIVSCSNAHASPGKGKSRSS